MSHHQWIAGAILLVAVAAPAQSFKCPAWQGKNPLAGVSVYDGPPAEKADLVPDLTKGSGDRLYASWDIGYLFGLGRTPYLVCRYAGLPDTQSVTLKIDKSVAKCIFSAHAGGQPADAECR
ncbi:MAG: STY0301 family protein [Terracidiphilus sp.]